MATSSSATSSKGNDANKLENIDGDTLYKYDEALHKKLCSEKPWKKDPKYFTHVKISATALIKMVMHARSGGSLEVMGMMQGKITGSTMIVTDAFALPVEGTETRVNASVEAMEYMVEYMEQSKKVGKNENAIGWYHSHPGYGCWLSGIDVNTQLTNQMYQEPFLAVVIDPVRTAASGKVTIGAFRTFPKDYQPPESGRQEYQSIPMSKIEDFGVHASAYYPLEVSYFKSSLDNNLLDLLWNKYWVNTLSSTPTLSNKEYVAGQIQDLAEKLDAAESSVDKRGFRSNTDDGPGPLNKIATDASRVLRAESHSLMSQVMKDILFNQIKEFDSIDDMNEN